MDADLYTEKDLWRDMQLGLRAEFGAAMDLTRHEDRLTPGTPDVSYGIVGTGGWVELKVLHVHSRNRPQDCDIRLRFEPQQPRWLMARGRVQRHVYVFARVTFRNDDRPLFFLAHASLVEALRTGVGLAALSRTWEGSWWGEPDAARWRLLGGWLAGQRPVGAGSLDEPTNGSCQRGRGMVQWATVEAFGRNREERRNDHGEAQHQEHPGLRGPDRRAAGPCQMGLGLLHPG